MSKLDDWKTQLLLAPRQGTIVLLDWARKFKVLTPEQRRARERLAKRVCTCGACTGWHDPKGAA